MYSQERKLVKDVGMERATGLIVQEGQGKAEPHLVGDRRELLGCSQEDTPLLFMYTPVTWYSSNGQSLNIYLTFI